MNDQTAGRRIPPDLDDMLRSTLAGPHLTAEQRRRHLQRLGLMKSVPASRSHSAHGATASQRDRRLAAGGQVVEKHQRRPTARQWVELAVAILAIAVVGGLLVLLFDGMPNDPEQRTGAPGTPTTRVPTESGAPGRLYTVSHVLERRDNTVRASGRLTAFDTASGSALYTVDTLGNIDAMLSPDGRRLFIASFGEEPALDDLVAIDAADGRELWRTTVEGRVSWKFGYGPTGMTISPDGSRLYVAACDFSAPYFCEPDADHWLAIIDTATGTDIGRLEAPGCLGAPYLSPDGKTLYVACQDEATRIFDIESGRQIGQLGDAPMAATSSANGRYLYGVLPIKVADRNRIDAPYVYRVYRLDMNTRLVVMQTDIPVQEDQPNRLLPLTAVAADGSRLFVGVNRVGDNESPAADRVLVLDAESLRSMGEITSATPITGQSLVAANDNGAVLGVAVNAAVPDNVVRESSVLRLMPGRESQTIATLSNEEVLRVMSGPIPDGPLPQTPQTATSPVVVASRSDQGQITVHNAATGEALYAIDAGANADATLAPSGMRLYVVSSREDGDGDVLVAYVATTGEERWRVTLHGHVGPLENDGAPTIGLAQDGRVVYVLTDSLAGRSLQWFDAGNGSLLNQLQGLPDCSMHVQMLDYPNHVYIACLGSGTIHVFDTQTLGPLGTTPGLQGTIIETAISPDNQHIYVVSEYDSLYQVAVIDTGTEQVTEQHDIVHLDRDPLLSLGLVTLSPDGSRLFVGIGYERSGESPYANEVWIWDTATWESLEHLQSSTTITGYGLVALDDQTVWGIGQSDDASVLIRLSPDGEDRIQLADDQTVVRLLPIR